MQSFEEADRRYAELRAAMIGRRMTAEQLSAALAELQVQDPRGAWWRIDPLSGDWLRWDGSAWRPEARPSGPASESEPLRIVVETIDASGKPASSLSHAARDVLWILAQCQGESGAPSAAGDATVRFSGDFDRAWATLADQGFQRGRRCAALRLVQPAPDSPPPPHFVVNVTAGQEGRSRVPVTIALDPPPERPAPSSPPSNPCDAPAPPPPPPAPACLMGWHLVVQTAPDVGLTIPLNRRTRLGRCPDNDLCPDYPDVSRYHAVLEVRDDACEIEDLKSTHGTTVNGVPVSGTQALSDGDLVELSSFRFYIRRQPVAAASATSPDSSTSGLPTLKARPDERVVARSVRCEASPEPPTTPPAPARSESPAASPVPTRSEPPVASSASTRSEPRVASPASARSEPLAASAVPAGSGAPAAPPASVGCMPAAPLPPPAKAPDRDSAAATPPAPSAGQATLACPICQDPCPAGATFCIHCGGRIPATRHPDQCSACGRKARSGARFCTGCGRPMPSS